MVEHANIHSLIDQCPVCPHQVKYHDGIGCLLMKPQMVQAGLARALSHKICPTVH